MYFITGFGVLMMILSIVMIVSPRYWSDGIISFSQKSYFHWFEVISRAIAGLIFVHFYESTLHPNLIFAAGCLLVAVSVGLVLAGSVKHRKFAVWSANKFKKTFRVSGFGSLCFGMFLVYISSFGA